MASIDEFKRKWEETQKACSAIMENLEWMNQNFRDSIGDGNAVLGDNAFILGYTIHGTSGYETSIGGFGKAESYDLTREKMMEEFGEQVIAELDDLKARFEKSSLDCMN